MYGYGWGFDPTFIILIPAMIFAAYAQSKINSTFNTYLKVRNSNGYTGYQVARTILDNHGLQNIPIELINGNLTDHYDPRNRILRLSNAVYNGDSLASVGVAAHECGHAVQHQEGYAPLAIRNTIAPVATIGSQLSWVLVIAGLFFGWMQLLDLGILFFTAAVVFQLITLPVEYNASSRAIAMLTEYNLVPIGEVGPAKKVLSAAALTYLAATIVAVMQLLRLLLLRGRRR
ncbi:MAG: peptidase rane zinc metallopeptidase [Clostridia bacterium]|jgi:Zn-dependent membrane protease YugP|nr:peptidase rane zinc metallopeptidase [Clostridia bacterium]